MLTLDALQFIQAFAPIISKAAMQTYYSALPLMPSVLLLSKKYSAISRPNLKSEYSGIINHPQVELPAKFWSCCISSEDIVALSLDEGGIAFFDTRTGNEIGSRIPTPKRDHSAPFAFSPDGKWIVMEGDYRNHERTLDLWNVKTRTRVKTIEIDTRYHFDRITFAADGENLKVMVVAYVRTFEGFVFIWDVKTDKPLKRLEVHARDVAISPDGSQIATRDELGIKIIDVSTGHIDRQITPCNDILRSDDPDPQIAWSPNGQFIASATTKQSETKLYLMSLARGSGKVPIVTQLGCFTRKYVPCFAFSPDSSKVVAVLRRFGEDILSLSIWCTRSGALVGTSYEMAIRFPVLSFTADGQDILICNYNFQNFLLYRFSVVPTHLETYMNDPPKFHPSQTPHTIQYSHHISGAIDDYASHVSADGWILNTKGEREIWTPCANYELLCSCKPPQEGRTHYRTLEVKDPQKKTVVMIYVIAFEQEDVSNGSQEAVVSVNEEIAGTALEVGHNESHS